MGDNENQKNEDPAKPAAHPFTTLRGWGDWTFRGLLGLGVAANLYLNREFLPRTEYKADQVAQGAQLEKLAESVTKLDRSLALIEAQQRRLDDHEIRLRDIERRQYSGRDRDSAGAGLPPGQR